MTCAEFEILLCDYLDGTLEPAARRAVEEHRAGCAPCSSFAADVSGAVAFMERVDDVEPPAELLNKITFDIPTGGAVRKGLRAWLFGWLQPVLQPRFAMGMAMTILSFGMIGRLVGFEERRLSPADFHPANVWATVDNRAHRVWERAVKYYENLRLVYEVQTKLQDWTAEEEQDNKKERADEGNQSAPDANTRGKERK